MKIKKFVKDWKKVGILLFCEFMVGAIAGLTYILFEPVEHANAIWMAATIGLFFQIMYFVIIGWLIRQWIGMGVSYFFNKKTGQATLLINSNAQARLEITPGTRKFSFPGDGQSADLDVELGRSRVSLMGLSLHIGIDSSLFSLDLVNIIKQQITSTFIEAHRFKYELDQALRNSVNPETRELFLEPDTEEKRRLRSQLMTLDLNNLFPMTTMRQSYAALADAKFHGGVRVGMIQSLKDLIKQPAVIAGSFLLLLLVGVGAYISMQTQEKVGQLGDQISQVSNKLSGVDSKLITIESAFKESETNKGLIPNPLKPAPAGGG